MEVVCQDTLNHSHTSYTVRLTLSLGRERVSLMMEPLLSGPMACNALTQLKSFVRERTDDQARRRMRQLMSEHDSLMQLEFPQFLSLRTVEM